MDKVKNELDLISPSFCAAKWLQVTLDLCNGLNHSCHHPLRHRVSVEEVQKNPATLHNTPYKKRLRHQMLEGVRPNECRYCWDLEDCGKDIISDRHIKSSDPWALPFLKDLAKSDWKKDWAPTYLEVMFDKTCQLSCSYCMASVSSSIEGEIRKFGLYPMPTNRHGLDGLKDEDRQILLNAFWKWFEQIKDGLHVFRITGGEPLLSEHTNRLMNELCLRSLPQLELSINSNLGVPSKVFERFLSQLDEVLKKKHVKKFDLYVSMESVGPRAEFIRMGLDYHQFLKNLEAFLQRFPDVQVIFMATYQILCMSSFGDFIKFVEELKIKGHLVILDCSVLKDPPYLQSYLADQELLTQYQLDLEYMKGSKYFNDYETQKFARIGEWMAKNQKEVGPIQDFRAMFFEFIQNFSKRYDRSFLKIFPEMSPIWKIAQKSRYVQIFAKQRT